MASIYEWVPLCVVEKARDDTQPLPKVYKLQNNYPCNESKAKIHKNNDKHGLSLPLINGYPI